MLPAEVEGPRLGERSDRGDLVARDGLAADYDSLWVPIEVRHRPHAVAEGRMAAHGVERVARRLAGWQQSPIGCLDDRRRGVRVGRWGYGVRLAGDRAEGEQEPDRPHGVTMGYACQRERIHADETHTVPLNAKRGPHEPTTSP